MFKARERTKARAYGEMNNPVRTHFDRSLESAIEGNYSDVHPSFESYVAMLDDSYCGIPPDVMVDLRKRFGRVEGQIEPGGSYWIPTSG